MPWPRAAGPRSRPSSAGSSAGRDGGRLCIGAMRHFRSLHRLAAGADPGRGGFNPRQERMQRQARQWGVNRLEEAMALLVETDLTLRSASRAPAMAVMERALIRLCTVR